MLSGGPLPNPHNQLLNTIAHLAHLTAVLPTSAPCTHIFGPDVIQALTIFRAVDANWDGIAAAAGRAGAADDENRWVRVQGSYRAGKHELARLLAEVRRVVATLVTLANEHPHASGRQLHLELELLMGLFVGVFEGMMALERDLEPREFDVVDDAVGRVRDVDPARVEADFRAPSPERDLKTLIESRDPATGEVGGTRPSLAEVQRAALWLWRQRTGRSGPPAVAPERDENREWKPIVLPPEIKLTTPEPRERIQYHPPPWERGGGAEDKRLRIAAVFTAGVPIIVLLVCLFGSIAPFKLPFYGVDFALKVAFCLMFVELPVLGLAAWLTFLPTATDRRRAVASVLALLIGLEALALGAWSVYLQVHGHFREVPCGEKTGFRFFFDDCGKRSQSRRRGGVSQATLFILDGFRILMVVGPLIGAVFYVRLGTYRRVLATGRRSWGCLSKP